MVSIKAINNKIILKATKEKRSSIIKNDVAEKTIVIFAEENSGLNVGDTVLLPKYVGRRFTFLDEELITCSVKDILLAIKGGV